MSNRVIFFRFCSLLLFLFFTFPSHRVKELPPVDIFVTTADPQLEPPIITVNTVLSLMAVDYPAHKLACYVSDDGCSPLTFYSLTEATKFAELWVPFCKKYNIQLRAPFRYFAGNTTTLSGEECSLEFQQARNTMRVMLNLWSLVFMCWRWS